MPQQQPTKQQQYKEEDGGKKNVSDDTNFIGQKCERKLFLRRILFICFLTVCEFVVEKPIEQKVNNNKFW